MSQFDSMRSPFVRRSIAARLLLAVFVTAPGVSAFDPPSSSTSHLSDASDTANPMLDILTNALPPIVTLSFTMAAFLAAFYALLRNNPSLRPESGSVFYAIALALTSGMSFLIAAYFRILAPAICSGFASAGGICFVGTIGLLVRVFWRSHVRMNYMHEGRGSGKFFIVSRLWRRLWPKRKTYEFEVGERLHWMKQSNGLLAAIPEELFSQLQTGGSLLILSEDMLSLRKSLLGFVGERIAAGDTVNYVTCAEAPYRILNSLQSLYPTAALDNLIFIDAFSGTFGFKDDIVNEASVRVQEKGVAVFGATTCAGLHRALKQAFNHTKRKQRKRDRKDRVPCLMVYDSCSALALLDSEEQVRIFVHHMLPAERSYKMLTLMIEQSDIPSAIKATMKCLADGTVVSPRPTNPDVSPQSAAHKESGK